jgi:hypothetical protein
MGLHGSGTAEVPQDAATGLAGTFRLSAAEVRLGEAEDSFYLGRRKAGRRECAPLWKGSSVAKIALALQGSI